jgi:hypothetical protein
MRCARTISPVAFILTLFAALPAIIPARVLSERRDGEIIDDTILDDRKEPEGTMEKKAKDGRR